MSNEKFVPTGAARLIRACWLLSAVAWLAGWAGGDALAVERIELAGHVPAAVAALNLAPVGRLPATTRLRLSIMLPPRDSAGIARLLEDLQNPASGSFRRYLTPEQYNERFAPAEADYQAVIEFAKAQGMTVLRTVPGRTIVEVEAAVADIERALHVRLQFYDHPREPRRFFAPDAEPSLEVAAPVIAVAGLNDFTLPRTRVHSQPAVRVPDPPANGVRGSGGSATEYGGLFLGTDFRNAFVPGSNLKGSGQMVGLLEWDSFTPADVTKYQQRAGLPNIPVVEIDVGTQTNLDNGDSEVSLDIDMVMAMAPGLAKVIVYHGYGGGGGYDAMLTEAADPTHGEGRPLQIGCSIATGVDNNTSNCLARLAVQGQSFFYAVGDVGAFPVEPAAGGHYLNGQWPTDTQPYMVQVGGTSMVMTNSGQTYVTETVWQGSSGGWQTPLPRPQFQQMINVGALGGSSTYRNVPDVAMPADNILVYCTGTNGTQQPLVESGTSCAAPLWAGFAALVNQQAAASGNPSLGYACPALYAIAQSSSYSSTFHDVVSGNNTNSLSPTRFFAATGYDLCTGWGSPRGTSLINALVGFGGPVFVDFNYTGPANNGSYDSAGSYDYPYKTLAAGVSGVSSGGTIFIRTAGTSTETMTIAKPMTITVSDGAATIGP